MDRPTFRILAVAGSLRQGSYNRGLLRAAQEVAPDWVKVQFFDIGQLPFFNEDIEASGDPEEVELLQGCHCLIKRFPLSHARAERYSAR